MQLPLLASWILVIAGAWSLAVWPQFLRRVMKDARARDSAGKATRFLTVHVVLVGVSMLLGAATAVIGFMALLS
jgi:hypothetical protein